MPVARYIPFLTLSKHCLIDVLVSTKRPFARFADLTSDEVADLFQCAHRIAPVLEKVYLHY